jgi:protein O-GlcNAcase/histone acetyltransferase
MSGGQSDFLAGVVEGFYGQPWAQEQRFALFERMARWGLNTYFYAPKDDLKHRALWREVYQPDELASLQELIQACHAHGVRFVYGLSPGLDIQFVDPTEFTRIRNRFAQLMDVGCTDFALLFDDLPGRMSDEDQERFGSVAAAQSSVANATYTWVRTKEARARFLFCPTAYCERMVTWNLGGRDYLDTLGQALEPNIDILWTGPEIVSREIPVDSIEQLAKRIRRRPVIWDNLHANDYDGRRLYCGPYEGRPLHLRGVVRGILTNPNNEFPMNFIPIRTLATYLRAGEDWQARPAYLAALAEWLEDYATVGMPVALGDLRLLTDAHYLPHQEGPDARDLLELVTALVNSPVSDWGTRHQEFLEINRRIQDLFDRLTELRDRKLFYAWSRRAWDLKEELQLVDEFLSAKLAGRVIDGGFCSETHLPDTYRGGFVARLQRVLDVDRQGRFRPSPRPTAETEHE